MSAYFSPRDKRSNLYYLVRPRLFNGLKCISSADVLTGIHIVLFCICVYTLSTRRNPAHLIILGFIVVMVAISVADIGLTYRLVLRDLPAVLKFQRTATSAIARVLPKGHLYVTNK